MTFAWIVAAHRRASRGDALAATAHATRKIGDVDDNDHTRKTTLGVGCVKHAC
jgi:hypothetical protein